MSLYNIARYSTDPEMVRFACMNGITQNPLYMQCDVCGNDICHVRQNIEDNKSLYETLEESKRLLAESRGEEYHKPQTLEETLEESKRLLAENAKYKW